MVEIQRHLQLRLICMLLIALASSGQFASTLIAADGSHETSANVMLEVPFTAASDHEEVSCTVQGGHER